MKAQAGKRWNMTFPVELSQGRKDRKNSFSSPIYYKFLQNFMVGDVEQTTKTFLELARSQCAGNSRSREVQVEIISNSNGIV